MSDRERLYRDDANAAFERACRLAEENEELRRELARYRGGRDVPTLRTRRAHLPSYVVAACTASFALLLAGVTSTILFAAEQPVAVTLQAQGPAAPAVLEEVPVGRAAETPYERSAMPLRFKDEAKCPDDPADEERDEPETTPTLPRSRTQW